MAILIRLILALVLCLPWSTQAQLDGLSSGGNLSASQLLRVEQAFRPQALRSGETIDMVWAIEPGYYMYRKQFRVFAGGEEIGEFTLPVGESAYDPFFDEELEIYRFETQLSFPLGAAEDLRVRFQGCADAGYCYPPSWVAFDPGTDGDSVPYLGLVEGPVAPAEPATTVRTWLLATAGLIALAIFVTFWLIFRGRRSTKLPD